MAGRGESACVEETPRTMGGENGRMLSSHSRGLTYDLQNLHTIIRDVEQASGPRGHASLPAR